MKKEDDCIVEKPNLIENGDITTEEGTKSRAEKKRKRKAVVSGIFLLFPPVLWVLMEMKHTNLEILLFER